MKKNSLYRPLVMLAVFTSVVISTITSSMVVHASDFATQFESEFVQPLVNEAPGGALIVVSDGKVVLQSVYGVREERTTNPVDEQTLFRIASLSKTVASAAAGLLVKDTSVSWHTPLRSNLPHLKFKEPQLGNQINLFHIMSQSSGLMPHAYTNLIEENMSYQRIVNRLDRVDFVCEPGACYGYQNVVLSLVGDLVESVTDQQYDEFVDRKLFTPLQMQRASMGYREFIEDDNHAKPHVWDGRRWRTVRSTSHYYKVQPAAGVNASSEDMKHWLLAQMGNRPEVLPESLLNEMHRGQVKTTRYQAHYPKRKDLGSVYYGLGWRVFDYGEHKGYVHHGGYVKGMCSAMVLHRPSGTGMVFLTNSEVRGMNELVLNFAELHNRYVKSSQVATR